MVYTLIKLYKNNYKYMTVDVKRIFRSKFKDLFVTYKGALTFILPGLLMLIVGSVVTNNKPAEMQNTLVATALGSLMALGFITNIFIVLGIDCIEIRKHHPKGKELTKAILKLVSWSMIMGIFNAFYLMFYVWIFTDVSHFMAPYLFNNNPLPIDWGGVFLSIFQLCFLSISMALLVSYFFSSKKWYAIFGLLYFLGFGYLAGGMFGPGATYWMMFPALIMPHTFIAHFLSASLTGGQYNVAHLPTKGDVVAVYNFWTLHPTTGFEDLLKKVFVTNGSSIWNLSVWHPEQWVEKSFTIHIKDITQTLGPFKMYNNFYQINAVNIFLPIVISLFCGTTFWIIKNK